MNQRIKGQILVIRNSGLTNMFDVKAVSRIAYEKHFYELVIFLEEYLEEYINFILYGDRK